MDFQADNGNLALLPGGDDMARRPTEEQIDQAVSAVRGTMAMEGFTATEEEEQLIKAVLRGDITEAEFLRRARERAERV